MLNQRDSFDYMLCYVHAFFLFLFCDSIVMKGFLSMINNTMDIDSKFICLCNFTTLATIVPLL